MTKYFRFESVKKIYLVCCCLLWIFMAGMLPANAKVLSDGEVTVAVGNQQSWTGRNGTGNLSYYGCDRQCQCIYLTKGQISCRDGVCQTVWQNKNYTYVLASPIAESFKPSLTSTLTILSANKVVAEHQLQPLAFDNLDSPN